MYRAINQVNEMFISLIKQKRCLSQTYQKKKKKLIKKRDNVYLKKQKQNSE